LRYTQKNYIKPDLSFLIEIFHLLVKTTIFFLFKIAIFANNFAVEESSMAKLEARLLMVL
jgi:hypothetical protein